MIKVNVNSNISMENQKKILIFFDNYNEYLERYIMYEIIAYCIAKSYRRHTMYIFSIAI